MKKTGSKKPVYQPPKLKTKSKWQAPEEGEGNESGDENTAFNPHPIKPSSKTTTLSKKLKTVDYNDEAGEDDPRMEYNYKAVPKKGGDSSNYNSNNPMKINTMTTFSRMDEDLREERENEQFEQYQEYENAEPGEDGRVACSN